MIGSALVRTRLASAMWVLLAFSLVPLLFVSVRTAVYFALHPEVLATRDSTLEALGVHAAFRLGRYPFAPAAVIALFFLVAGPRAMRLRLASFVAAFFAVGALGSLVPFESPGRIVTDVASCVLPFVLALVFAVRRHDRAAPAARPVEARAA